MFFAIICKIIYIFATEFKYGNNEINIIIRFLQKEFIF